MYSVPILILKLDIKVDSLTVIGIKFTLFHAWF